VAVGEGAAGEASTAMKTRRKTATIVVSAAIVCAVIVAFLVYRSRAAAQKVFVTKVVRENLSAEPAKLNRKIT
jgi:hypothetical protein